ncbi:hypothetical protein VitviT2T_002796 [Vitis vinifera]|uniref:Bulb-type lectin domain-containing protein n=1 Tax=Vitis vinifera TaxID=29760 RepID=A0ABY9BJX4_VITVI|nr:hypothetical protein VitviT2T_002796 [Vitis vinifera]
MLLENSIGFEFWTGSSLSHSRVDMQIHLELLLMIPIYRFAVDPLETTLLFEEYGSSGATSKFIEGHFFDDVESEPSDQDDAGCKNFLEALQTASTGVTYATMLDIGNLMLAGYDPTYFWQSFNPPTDTILPTQMLNQGSKLVARFSEKNPEVNYKKIDKPDELLNEDLKLENEWQQFFSNMLTMYKGLFTQPSAI